MNTAAKTPFIKTFSMTILFTRQLYHERHRPEDCLIDALDCSRYVDVISTQLKRQALFVQFPPCFRFMRDSWLPNGDFLPVVAP